MGVYIWSEHHQQLSHLFFNWTQGCFFFCFVFFVSTLVSASVCVFFTQHKNTLEFYFGDFRINSRPTIHLVIFEVAGCLSSARSNISALPVHPVQGMSAQLLQRVSTLSVCPGDECTVTSESEHTVSLSRELIPSFLCC